MAGLSDYFTPGDPNAAAMTHWPEEPNPAEPYARKAIDFFNGGLKGAGVDIMPGWVDRIGAIFQNPDNMAAMPGLGMAKEWAPRLKELMAAGNTYSQMAKDIGVSRSAIAGAVRDQRLTGQGNKSFGRISDEEARSHEVQKGPRSYTPVNPSPYVEDTAGVRTKSTDWITLPDGTLQKLYSGQ